jgi:hypothetical protein
MHIYSLDDVGRHHGAKYCSSHPNKYALSASSAFYAIGVSVCHDPWLSQRLRGFSVVSAKTLIEASDTSPAYPYAAESEASLALCITWQ